MTASVSLLIKSQIPLKKGGPLPTQVYEQSPAVTLGPDRSLGPSMEAHPAYL